MKLYICNAFSLSMLDREVQSSPVGDVLTGGARVPTPVSESLLNELVGMMGRGDLNWESAVGHASTAWLFANQLGLPIETKRVSIKLDTETRCLIGQYIGPRLEEGATELPEGARIEWWII